MAYIVERKDRFFVVEYDGIHPITGRERRNWRLSAPTAARPRLVGRLDLQRAEARPPRSPTVAPFDDVHDYEPGC